MKTYAVVWDEATGSRYAGRLALNKDELVLEGSSSSGRSALRRLSLDDVTGVHIERGPADRISDLPALVVERAGGRRVRVSCLDRPGMLTELAEALSAARGGR